MTVCVAAIASYSTTVMVCDKMATYQGGDITADGTAAKLNNLNAHWHVLMAGDLGRAQLVVEPSRWYFTKAGWGHKWSAEEVASVVKREYQSQLRTEVTDTVLSQYGLDLETFMREGLARFGAEGFAETKYKIDQASRDFNLELLLVGFDKGISASIILVSNPGVIADRANPGFWAIGSGATMALSSLAMKGQCISEDVPKTIFNACEAKFQSERSVGVGKDTWVAVESPYYRYPDAFSDELVAQIRTQWENENRKQLRLPVKVKALLEPFENAEFIDKKEGK